MNYQKLLKNAPEHDTPEFLQFLRNNNIVVYENDKWLVIENCKYHSATYPWYTAFHKTYNTAWFQDINTMLCDNDWEEWAWLKKSAHDQSVKRFHIHLYREEKDPEGSK